MNKIAVNRRNDIDFLKAICIIVVVIYHMGYLESGYLGVDAFFVINGFLVIPSTIKNIQSVQDYIRVLFKRVLRLLPLVLSASLVCLIVAYLGFLPDDYENLAQSVIASSLFGNNILAAITTKNYWDVVNEFKPLMHTWYLGILMQFYVLYPICVLIINRLFKNENRAQHINRLFLYFLFIVSLILYLNPSVTDGDRFYYLQSRLFEISFGGIVSLLLYSNRVKAHNDGISFVSILLLFAFLFSGWYLVTSNVEINPVIGTQKDVSFWIQKQILLISTVILTGVFLFFNKDDNRFLSSFFRLRLFSQLGKMTLSIFIWHQIVFAFYRCYWKNINQWWEVVVLLIITSILAIASYYLVEKRNWMSKMGIGIVACLFAITLCSSFYLFIHAGVVRDVPELGIKKETASRNMYGKYSDRIYKLDKDFPAEKDGKINVLVEGVSFGRDFANVLLESEIAPKLNVSYTFRFNDSIISRYQESDYIFTFNPKNSVPDYVWNHVKNKNIVWGIGPKSFGANNSAFYLRRNRDDYYQMSARIDGGFKRLNAIWKNGWKDNYVDMISLVENEDGTIKIFTDDHQYISQDCRHLTIAGAKYYAKIINWDRIIQ